MTKPPPSSRIRIIRFHYFPSNFYSGRAGTVEGTEWVGQSSGDKYISIKWDDEYPKFGLAWELDEWEYIDDVDASSII